MDLKELSLVNPKTNWYYRAKLYAILCMMEKHSMQPSRIVDVGAGSGFFGRSVRDKYINSELHCVDTNYSQDSVDTDGTVLKTSSKGVTGDFYMFIDVLEHVDDDYGLVVEYLQRAAENTSVIITVPAFMSLWSGHDIFLEHKRRYTRKELDVLCHKLNLKHLESGYLFSTIFPIAYIVRKLRSKNAESSSMKESNHFVNFVLKFVCMFEHRFFRNRFFGLSTYLVARK